MITPFCHPKKGCLGCRASIGTSGSPVGSQVLVVAPRKGTALDHALPDGLVVTCRKLRTSQNLEISTKKTMISQLEENHQNISEMFYEFMKSEYIEICFRFHSPFFSPAKPATTFPSSWLRSFVSISPSSIR